MSERGDQYKHDQHKPMWDLLPMNVIEQVVKVLTFGARKYGSDNWKKIPESQPRYYAAAMRHITSWFSGEKIDPESGLPHLAHALCCLVFLLWFDLTPKKRTRNRGIAPLNNSIKQSENQE